MSGRPAREREEKEKKEKGKIRFKKNRHGSYTLHHEEESAA